MEILKDTHWKERYWLIPEIAEQLQCQGAEHRIYLHQKWVSFKGKAAKKKQVSMEKPEAFAGSCSATTAIKDFRGTRARYGLFFGHLLQGMYTESQGFYHATVLILENDEEGRKAYLFNPFKVPMKSLSPLTCALVSDWSSTVKDVKLITGRQYRNSTTCVIHAAKFAELFVSNPTEVLEGHKGHKCDKKCVESKKICYLKIKY